MERIPVKSSNIASIGWSAETETLEVEFKSKKEGEPTKLYQYANVPYDRYKAFLNAPSVGSHFAAHVRENYICHRIDHPKEKQDAKDEEETKD